MIMATNLQTGSEQSLTSVVTGIVGDFQELIKQQLALFKAELKQDLRRTREASISLVCGVALLGLGSVLLCFMAVHLLFWAFGPNLPLWACYLIVGGLLAAAGGGLTYFAWTSFRSVTAEQSVQSLEENLEWKTKPH
jgi:uncharacterized membrane protein YqjE